MNLNPLPRFKNWWKAPVNRRDRLLGVFIGGLAGFWIGLLGRLLLGPNSFSFQEIGAWAFGLALLFAVLGYRFPKIISVLLYPLALIGVGGSS